MDPRRTTYHQRRLDAEEITTALLAAATRAERLHREILTDLAATAFGAPKLPHLHPMHCALDRLHQALHEATKHANSLTQYLQDEEPE
mgnify:CR=1 FL=1